MENKRQSIVDKVYHYCLNKIETGEWKAGTKIPSESELHAELGISKVSIRAALQMLRTMGLITTHQGKGSFVSNYINQADSTPNRIIVNFTDKELLDMTEFREAIEVKAVELCIRNATREDMEEIEAALADMEKNTHDYKKYSKADVRFHLAILKGAHNKVLSHSVMSIQSDYVHYLDELNRVFAEHNLKDSYKLHKQIYESIRMKDEKLAVSLVMLNLRRNVLRIKRKLSGEDLNDYLHL
ncbi:MULTISPECIES: FadR/GntR family transcriptional regulator [unclassified Paenibacillus]|uniref:FadR/GntR family transcriptional regulator n=1 Tax=unclassified Paenibacillus TaxID=185978 RepID=UPI001C107462|nr:MULTISPECIES: FadR/GntR family transcriptional regulator [unclassified Paenibacillus]MBU5443908.1 FadR family transcriptional regulator [Paenibacillus sp. MSJ-34]CAH0121211.1 Fatty acid metabolism regulator protein [Paenibacillus sp. CECT 9249]